MMQITDLQQEQKITPVFRLGFRPFFLGGAIFSIISILIWVLILRGLVSFSPLGGGYWWHIHEMVFGFGCAIIAGFLLTAVQTWTGSRGIHGKKLLFLFLLWFLGRIALLFPMILGASISAIVDLSFLIMVAIFLGKPIIAVKQYRNLFFVPLLLLFTLANLQMHLSLIHPETFKMNYAGYSAVMLIAFLMSVMVGRVVPMFTANGTQTTKVQPIKWLEYVTNGSLALAMLTLLLVPLLGFNNTFFGITLVIAALSQGIRGLRYRPWITLNVPLLWSLHLAIFFIWLGLLSLGLGYILLTFPTNNLWHLLTIGGMGGLILAMISRVSLGHTGRPLSPPKLMNLAFLAISFAAITRVLGPMLWPEKSITFIDSSAFLWVVAFGLFAITYGPMLLSKRADDRPG